MYELNKRINAGVVLGVCVAMLNMDSMPNTNVLELPLHEPRILLPLPHVHSTVPQEIVLVRSRIPDKYLHMGMKGRTPSKYFVDISVTQLFISILLAPIISPQKILETKVLKTRFTPYVAVMINKYREDKQIRAKSFSSPIFDTLPSTKLDTWSAVCAYIISNFRTELELLDDNALMVDSGSDSNQSDDKDLNVENILDQPSIDGVPEGEPSAINAGLSNIDEDTNETHHSRINQDDTILLLSLLDTSREEATPDRKRYHTNHANEVTKSTKDCFCKSEYSHIQTKILKRTDSGG